MSPGLVSMLAAAAVIVRLAYRELSERKVRLSRIFAAPVVLVAIAILLFVVALTAAHASALALVGATIAGLAIGTLAGVASAHYTTLRVADVPGMVYTRGSYVTLAIWLGALGLRLIVRFSVVHTLANEAVANAAIVALLAASICVVRYRIFVKARAAIAAHVGATVTAI